jgi:hypothetical protein
MKYLVFNTEQQAKDRSAQEAQARGCDPTSTKYWWEVRQTKAGKWALCIDDISPRQTETTIEFNGQEITEAVDSSAGLTPSEISALKDSVVWPDAPTV